MSSVSALNSLLSSASSTSAIDISSILQAAMGSSSTGIDVTAAVNSAITAARAPETAWQNEQVTLQSQANALTKLQTDANNLDTDLQALNTVTGPLSARTASSSNSSIVSASAASGSAIGNHVVTVTSLATTDTWASNVVADPSHPGSFSITTAKGTYESTGTGTSTLSDLARAISQSDLGITASVITDASGSRLAIVSNTSGSASNFTVTSGSMEFSEAVPGNNAHLTVDGIDIESSSNSVSGALPGVTFNLLNASPGTNVSVTVTPDVAAASAAINQFVTDYNTAIKDLNTQFTFNGSSQGPLATDSAVRSLQATLGAAISYTQKPASGTTTVPNLSSLGISMNHDGTLTVNSATLTGALQNNNSDVQNFFQGAALDGFAHSLYQQLNVFIDPADGAFTLDLKSMNTEYSSLQTDINNFETNRIAPLRIQMQAAYAQAEIALQQLPVQTQQLNTLLGYNTSSNG